MRLHTLAYSLALVLLIALASCTPSTSYSPSAPTLRPVPTLFPTSAAYSPPSPTSAAQQSPDSGWIAGSNGIELRRLLVSIDERRVGSVIIGRIDPQQVRLRVGYAPSPPQALRAWYTQGQTLLVVNGGFFTEDFQTTALVISDGTASGTSYEGFGGMLAVTDSGEVTIQPLRDQPYDPSVPLVQAMQSFPMLVFPGGVAAQVEDSNEEARRTAIAIDRAGRLLVIVCGEPVFTLNELAQWLVTSDLEVDRALNFDGGSSTGLYIDAGAAQERIDPFTRLPLVLLVEQK